MAQTDYAAAPRTLIDAVSRDLVIAVLFGAACLGLQNWYAAGGSTSSLIAGWVASFVLGFIFIYLSHEWGHYLGARLAGARVPLGSGNGILLGLFDPALYSRRQFMWMAVGGEVGYLIPAPLFIVLFWDTGPLQGLAVAGAAFIVQALYVDIPVLSKVRHGANIQQTLDEGTAPNVILRKTAISWGLLALALVLYAALG